MQKAALIFVAIIIGCIFNVGHNYTYLIRYNLMVMLFFAFLNTEINANLFKKEHFKVLAINILLPIICYFLIKPFHEDLANIAFVITVTPTAAAGPVIAEIMKTNVGTLAIAVILGTPLMAIFIPLMLANFMSVTGNLSIFELVYPVLTLVFIPLAISQFIRKFSVFLKDNLSKLSFLSLPLFLLNVFIACGNASYFIQTKEGLDPSLIFKIIIIVIILGTLQFQTGQFIGRNQNPLGFSLAMGRKNTMIALWLAITYFNPVVALGPIFYIIFHNTYNSIQIWQMEKRQLE